MDSRPGLHTSYKPTRASILSETDWLKLYEELLAWFVAHVQVFGKKCDVVTPDDYPIYPI